MRTPDQYIEDMTDEVLPRFMQNLSVSSVSANDQYHAEMQRMARNIGVNPESQGFKASLLLASDLLDGLAASLQDSEIEERETGAHFIREASARLRILSIWGSACKKDCLDLR
jgi:hypothetical protein